MNIGDGNIEEWLEELATLTESTPNGAPTNDIAFVNGAYRATAKVFYQSEATLDRFVRDVLKTIPEGKRGAQIHHLIKCSLRDRGNADPRLPQ